MQTSRLLGNDESAIATKGNPLACLETDLRAAIESCIEANKTNPPPANPGPFDRGYKEIVVLLAQCFGGEFRFTLSGIPGSNYVIEATEDFEQWLPIATNPIPPGGDLTVDDPQAPAFSNRFYRALRF